MIYNDIDFFRCELPIEVGFLTRFALHRGLITLGDDLEKYDELFIEFGKEARSYEYARDIVKYIAKKMKERQMQEQDFFVKSNYIKQSLYNNLKIVRRLREGN